MVRLIKRFFHWVWYGTERPEYISEKTLMEIRYNLGKEKG